MKLLRYRISNWLLTLASRIYPNHQEVKEFRKRCLELKMNHGCVILGITLDQWNDYQNWTGAIKRIGETEYKGKHCFPNKPLEFKESSFK